MNQQMLERIGRLPHLAAFTEKQLITEVGLYERILIDTMNIRVENQAHDDSAPEVFVSNDVATLHDFVINETTEVIPCAECRADRPFKAGQTYFPKRSCSSKWILSDGNQRFNYIKKQRRQSSNKEQVEDPSIWEPHYWFGINTLQYGIQLDKDRSSLREECAAQCFAEILANYDDFRKEYVCTLNSDHRIITEYVIKPAVRDKPDELITFDKKMNEHVSFPIGKFEPEMTKAQKKVQELFQRYRFCLIIMKIGQYPSMADMQLFETRKYQKVLGKEHYRDLTTGLRLYADGVGAAAFLYLRRILESLVEELHQECKDEDGWDDTSYNEAFFNDKIKIIEETGRTVIPAELAEVRERLYGVLSIGCHQASDEDCKAVFPYMKFAIECILDKKVEEQERKKKLNKLLQMTNKFESEQKGGK